MRGCITKKGAGYSIIVDIGKDSSGKRKQKWFNGFKTKKEAQKELNKILNQLDNNTYINPEKTTLKDYLKQWICDYVEVNLKQKTIEGYIVNIEGHIIPAIGDISLQKLQPVHIQNFYKHLLEKGRLDGKGGLSAKSVVYIHRVLRKALDSAVKLQLLSRNVADLVEPPKPKQYKAKYLNEIQIQNLLVSIKSTRAYIPVLLAVGLGLRRGEALGLQWKDIDFNSKEITISRVLLPSKKGLIFNDPKTETSERIIVASSTIIDELKILKNKQQENKNLLKKAYKDNDLVVCYDDGSPFNPATFSHVFAKLLERNNLPHIRFHDLRHTNATLMLKNNIPAKIASERLGHSSIGITLDLYSHVMNEMQEDAANKLEYSIFNKE